MASQKVDSNVLIGLWLGGGGHDLVPGGQGEMTVRILRELYIRLYSYYQVPEVARKSDGLRGFAYKA